MTLDSYSYIKRWHERNQKGRWSMVKKQELAVRGRDVKVVPKYVCGPWHSKMYGAYTSDGNLLGLFFSYFLALNYILSAGHRVRNMTDVLLGAATEMRMIRELQEMLRSKYPAAEFYGQVGIYNI